MPSANSKVLRIAIGEPEGRHSSVLRIWFGPADIYAAFRTFAHIWKASIHYPRPGYVDTVRYVGYTRDYAEKVSPELAPIPREQRTHSEWRGVEIAPGFFMEFRFRVPESELRVFPLNEDLWRGPRLAKRLRS